MSHVSVYNRLHNQGLAGSLVKYQMAVDTAPSYTPPEPGTAAHLLFTGHVQSHAGPLEEHCVGAPVFAHRLRAV